MTARTPDTLPARAGSAQQQPTKAQRMAAARRVLSQAEAAAGLRTRLAPPLRLAVDDEDGARGGTAVAWSGVDVTSSGTDSGRSAATEAGIERSGPRAAAVLAAPTATSMAASTDGLPVPAALVPLLPTAGLRRGSVVQVTGSTALLLALAAAAAQDGGWTALTALPDVGLQAAAEAGLVLGHCVLVPRPGPEAAAVLGALADGFDVLVVGSCRALRDRDRRLLSARLRTRGAVLLSTTAWPGSDLVLHADQRRPHGVGSGWGAVAGQQLTVHATGRGATGGQVRVRVDTDGLVADEPLDARPSVGPGVADDADAADRRGLRAVS